MTRKTKGIICLLCVFMLLVTSIVPAMAGGKNLAFDMESMSITTGMNAGTREEEYVRRDEFAQMVVNMIGQQDVAKALENDIYFSDISDSNYKGAINLLAKMNYVSGSGNSTYNPSEYITYGAACKILVHALGYDVITEDKSLYGYQYTAGNIKLTDNIDSSKPYLSFGQVMIMIDNALDIGLMVPMYYNANLAPSYEIDEGRTYRSLIQGRTIGTGIIKKTGVITADASTYLYDEVANLKPTQLQIDEKVYDFDGIAPKGYVGQRVDFYVTYNNFEEGHITAINPTNENTVCDFSGDAIDTISDNEIKFFTNDGRKYKVKADYTTRFIVNNRFVSGYDVSKELKAESNVFVRTIDNDVDELADVVFVYTYTDCIVEKISTETNTITFEDGFTYGTMKNLKLDEDKMSWEIYDANGKEISFESIKAEDILSIAISNDNEAVRIVKSDKTVEGVVVERDGKYIVIDGTEYVLGETAINEEFKIGKKIIAYTNFIGIIVDYEEVEGESNYAYVYSYSAGSSLGGNYKVKLLLPEYISVKKVEGLVDEMTGEAATSNALFARNKDVVIYPAEDKIVFNGVKKKAEVVFAEVLDKPVSYHINSNGKVYKIDTLDAVDNVDIKASEIPKDCVSLFSKTYNGSENLFAKTKGEPFAVEKDYTLAFCVPMYAEQAKSTVSDEDLKVYIELSHNWEYETNGYEMDDITSVAKVMVIQEVMLSDAGVPVLDTSDIGLVLSVSNVLSEDKTTEHKAIKMLTNGGEYKYIVAEERVNESDISKLEKNDLIQYTLDGFDQINTVKILQKNDEYYESFVDDYYYGEIKNIAHNKISNTRARRINEVSMGYSNSDVVESTVDLLIKGAKPVFIIEGKEARIATLDDIQIGDMMYVSLYNTTEVRAVVIKR